MELMIIGFFLLIAGFFVGMGYFVKDFLFKLAGSVIFLIIGMSIWVTGFTFQEGINETYNITETYEEGSNITKKDGYVIQENIYKEKKNLFTHGLGLIMVLLSIYLGLISWDIYKGKQESVKIRF